MAEKFTDPLVGQFVEILTIKAKSVNVWTVKAKATPEGMKAFEFELDAFPEHIRMFKASGMKIQDGLPYDCGGYPHMGKIGLHGTSRRIVQMISDFGGFLSLEDSEKQHELELEKARSIPALALVEAPKQENVGTPYILPDSKSAKLAQLVALAESVLKDMPDYAIAAQIVQHARILQGLQLNGKPEQLAEVPKKKRR